MGGRKSRSVAGKLYAELRHGLLVPALHIRVQGAEQEPTAPAEAAMTVAKGPLKRELMLYAEERTRIG